VVRATITTTTAGEERRLILAKRSGGSRHSSDPLHSLRAAHRLWDDGRYPEIRLIKNCSVEINLTNRKINIIKGRKVITVVTNIPFAILRRIAIEVEVLDAQTRDQG
jgi:hypothetical protein